MSNLAFTNGPWTVGAEHVWHTDDATGMGYRFRPIDFPGGCLAWVADDEGDPEGEANAALIAAAPILFELLSEIADAYEGDDGQDEMCGRGVDSQLVQARILVQQLRDGTFAG